MERPSPADLIRSAHGIAFDCYGTLLRLGADLGVTRRAARLLSASRARSPVVADIGLGEALVAAGVDPAIASDIDRDAREEADGALPIEGALEAVGAIMAAGLRIAIGSNLSREYAPPIARFMPDVPRCLSFEVGFAKPQPAFYEALASRMGLEPKHIVMIGDSRRCDHDGPMAAGMGAILLGEDRDGVATMRSVADLAHLLRQWEF